MVILTPHDGEESVFGFWRLSGRKSLLHDGRRLLLSAEKKSGRVRVCLAHGLRDAMPYAYGLPAGASMNDYRRMLDPVVQWMAGYEPMPSDQVQARPPLGAVVHMRALQAYDGRCAGATQREIAAVLFGPDAVSSRWDPDSELRSHIRYLLERARYLVNGGYLSLFASKRQGESPRVQKTP